MKFNKQIVTLLIFGLISMLLVACGGNSNNKVEKNNKNNNDADQVTLRVGTLASNEEGSILTSLDRFAKDVDEASDGRIKIEIYPGAQLGGEVEMTEQLQLGSLDMASITSNTLANYVEEMYTIEIPFLFKDRDHAWNALDGSVGDKLSEKAEEAGFVNLGYWDVGFKNISNNKNAVKNVDDVKGMDIRVGQSNILIDTYKALGANPTPIAFPEVYTSIQQGLVDGFEGAYQPFEDGKLYEIQDHVSEVQIMYHTNLLLFSKSVFDDLDEEAQEIIKEMAEKQVVKQREENLLIEEDQRKMIQEEGVEIIEYSDIDKSGFEDAVQSVFDKYEGKLGEYIKEAQEME